MYTCLDLHQVLNLSGRCRAAALLGRGVRGSSRRWQQLGMSCVRPCSLTWHPPPHPGSAGGSDSSLSGRRQAIWSFQHPPFQVRKARFPRDGIKYMQLFHFGDNCIATSMAAEKWKDCKIAVKEVARLHSNGFEQQLLLLSDVSAISVLSRSLSEFSDMTLPYGTKQQKTQM